MSSPPAAPPPAAPRRLHVQQKVTPFQNTYRVLGDRDGEPSSVIAFVKQKRVTFKESFTVYADETATRAVLTIRADRAIDVRSVLTVTEVATGEVVGRLRKRGAASLLRSTWELEQPGMPVVVVQERSLVIALLRRLFDLVPYVDYLPIPWVFHFDGTSGDVPVLRHSRLWGIRDRYVMELLVPQLDARLAIALAICLDAMQSR